MTPKEVVQKWVNAFNKADVMALAENFMMKMQQTTRLPTNPLPVKLPLKRCSTMNFPLPK